MKSTKYIILLLAAMMAVSFTEPLKKGIDIEVTGIEQREGNILVAVFNSQDDFLKKDYWSKLIPLSTDGRLEIQIDHLPEGEYAVSVVHDTNGNGQLDTNFLGIPREPYGFSNNPRSRLRPPTFAETKFLHRADSTILNISLTSF